MEVGTMVTVFGEKYNSNSKSMTARSLFVAVIKTATDTGHLVSLEYEGSGVRVNSRLGLGDRQLPFASLRYIVVQLTSLRGEAKPDYYTQDGDMERAVADVTAAVYQACEKLNIHRLGTVAPHPNRAWVQSVEISGIEVFQHDGGEILVNV